MNEIIDLYIDNIDEMLRKLSPAEQKKMLNMVGSKIRKRNQARIIANLQPNGVKMRRRKSARDFLQGYRKLRANENITIGKLFIYDGPEMRQRNIGLLRSMTTIKTPQSDRKYGAIWRVHKGGGRYQRTPYDPDYVHGFALAHGAIGQDGVSKFNRNHIYVKGKSSKKELQKNLMFRKINQFKYLKMKATSHEVAIGFLGGLTAKIAAAHQYGEDNRPVRELLGFSDEDIELIEQTIREYLSLP